MDSYRLPTVTREDLKPKKHHGYAVLIFIVGTLLPPVGEFHHVGNAPVGLTDVGLHTAVALRFGIGKDFFLNCILTLCGYIPGMRSYASLRSYLQVLTYP